MKLLIVEDEQLLARQLTKMLLSLEPGAEIIGQTNSIESTVDWLRNNEMPDIIFMDIELADGQCFAIFEKFPLKSPVIFTTAYDEYVLKAFKVNSIDYLLKPIKPGELKTALEKWKEIAAPRSMDILKSLVNDLVKTKDAAVYRERFLVKQGQKMISVSTGEIAFFNAKNTLNYITTKSKQKFLLDYTLDDIEQLVEPKKFFRANRQFIVSHDIITAIHPWFNGKLKVETRVAPDDEIIISREKASQFREWMGA